MAIAAKCLSSSHSQRIWEGLKNVRTRVDIGSLSSDYGKADREPRAESQYSCGCSSVVELLVANETVERSNRFTRFLDSTEIVF